MTTIDLDAHATTPLHPLAWEAMARVFRDANANPASAHAPGRRARRFLEDAREAVAGVLAVSPAQVTFTSGATEANNLAVFGSAPAGCGLLASRLEHPCVAGPLETLATRGHRLAWHPVTPAGVFDLDALPAPLDPGVKLVCLMLANHETGAVQPVRPLADRLPPGVRLHTDAAQAVGKMPVSFPELGASSLSLSAHKFGGPKGVGALILKPELPLQALFFGGHQQSGQRPGTEPVALAAALAAALGVAVNELEARTRHLELLRATFYDILTVRAAPVVRHGPEHGPVLPGCLNVAFPGCRSDLLLMRLDLEGVHCSAGAACASGSLLPSPVLRAMGVPEQQARSAVRFSFHPTLTADEVVAAAHAVARAAQGLRGKA